MLIVDSHLDIAYNALEWDRDLLQPIAKIREAEAGMAQKGRGLNVVNFAELRRGGIGLFFVTVHCRLASQGRRFPGVRTQDIAYASLPVDWELPPRRHRHRPRRRLRQGAVPL